MESLKAMIKSVLPNLIGFVVLYLIVLALNIHTIIELALLIGAIYIGIILFKIVWKKEKIKWWGMLLDYIKSIVTVYIILFLFRISLTYGTLGITIYIIVYSIWRIFGSKKRRFNYFNALRTMEEAIFGKSLDKENWKAGELKRLKFKFKWRNTNEDNKKTKCNEKMEKDV